MKIWQILESKEEDFDNQLKQTVQDILVLYKTNGANVTHTTNIISELGKKEIEMSTEELVDIVQDLGYTIDGEEIVLADDEDMPDDLDDADLEGEEYDPVDQMAKDGLSKDLK